MEKKYGIIGWPLSITQSPNYFNSKFQAENITATYLKIPLESIAEFPQLVESKNSFRGFNVTIPYKEKVIPFLHALDESAREIGAVNTIKINEAGEAIGYNTDWIGFRDSLSPYLPKAKNRALIFGWGGSAKAVAYALEQMGIPYKVVSRNPTSTQLCYDNLDENLKSTNILINTTPLGMKPLEISQPDIPYELVSERHVAFDLIYEPEKTLFLKRCEANGATIINGQKMFFLQAEAAWKIWNDPNQ